MYHFLVELVEMAKQIDYRLTLENANFILAIIEVISKSKDFENVNDGSHLEIHQQQQH